MMMEDCIMSKKQAFNPYLPSWEFVPDGEPHVFDGRVYIYGSHDFYNGDVFCMGDYVCWSADIHDLGNWRYEGVIYKRNEDPGNPDGEGCLYAPDVTKGPDGRYYLYYVVSNLQVVSVAVCDEPAGKYTFLGYVHDQENRRIGEREGDEPQFDPGVLTEGDKTYLYTGFCGRGDKSRHGAMGMLLGRDMLTVLEGPVIVAPGCEYSEGTGFEGHEYFEAASIRKKDDLYLLIYSSVVMHELCYAYSKSPLEGFQYGGVLNSNVDLGIDTYKPADRPAAFGANNHGSIVEMNGDWYIFYHRHTNGTWFSRQGCAEKLPIREDGLFGQAELTSCGLNGGPLAGEGYYPSCIACHLFTDRPVIYVGDSDKPEYVNGSFPKIVKEGWDGDQNEGNITNMYDQCTAGFRYFDLSHVSEITLTIRGYAYGSMEIRTSFEGSAVKTIPLHYSNIWRDIKTEIKLPEGADSLYFTYRGPGSASFKGFTLK